MERGSCGGEVGRRVVVEVSVDKELRTEVKV